MRRIFLMFVIVSLVLFVGCSDKITENVMSPGTDYVTKVVSGEVSSSNYKYEALINNYTTVNPRMFNMEKDYLLKLVYSSLMEDRLTLNNPNVKNALISKLEVVIRLVAAGKNIPAIQKIEKDILPFTKKWLLDAHKKSAVLSLEATLFILKNGCPEVLINVDYFEEVTEITGYAWLQSLYGERSCMLQVEGNPDVFFNDPIFYVLFNLQEVNNETFYRGILLQKVPYICDCPLAGVCQCHALFANPIVLPDPIFQP
ncbi:hypothetical protein KAI78_02830 [bacterium]|nr:hypothetical protein [bacterium]